MYYNKVRNIIAGYFKQSSKVVFNYTTVDIMERHYKINVNISYSDQWTVWNGTVQVFFNGTDRLYDIVYPKMVDDSLKHHLKGLIVQAITDYDLYSAKIITGTGKVI